MKIVQTRIGDTEYTLLRKKAAEEKKTLQEVLREAVERYVTEEKVDPSDPLFSEPVAEKGARDGSIRHNKYLYGEGE
jgi:hypothetical protein